MRKNTKKVVSKQSSETTQYDAREKRIEVELARIRKSQRWDINFDKACSQPHCDDSKHQAHLSPRRFHDLIDQRNQQEIRLCSGDPLPGESDIEAKRRSTISRWFYSSLHSHRLLKSEVSLT